ncbi:MAG: hypothetical protein AAGE80_18295 [Pseudomonadota bacterium]
MALRACAAALSISLILVAAAEATISNRVSLRNERLERHELLQRCTAFFILIAEFRDRRPGEGVRLKDTAEALSTRSAEVLTDEQDLSAEDAATETDAAIAALLEEYRATLREQFGPVQSATFRTYDLLLMQEDLKFCKDLAKAEGLAPKRPLPAR